MPSEESKVLQADLVGGVRRAEFWNRMISESIVFGAIIVAGTLVAYQYEYGYVSVAFGVPADLIQLETSRIICSTALVVVMLIAFVGISFLTTLVGFDGKPRLGATAIIVGLGLTSNAFDHRWWITPLAMVLLFLVSFVLSKISAALGVSRSHQQIVWIWLIVIGVIGVGSRFVARMGEMHAVEAGSKFVLIEDPTLVLVRRFGQCYVFAEVDLATGLIGDRMELRDNQNAPVKLKRVASPKLHR